MAQDKKIHIFYVNKIKDLELKIFEYQDDEYPNGRAVAICERHIEKWLTKAGVLEEGLRREVRSCISWNDNHCNRRLREKGWTILTGKEALYGCNR